MKIIDGHAHMFTLSMFESMKIPVDKIPPRFKGQSNHSVQENVDAWIKSMDEMGIEKTVFMATVPLNKNFIDFINSSDRLIGMASINPTDKNAVATLKK